MYTSIFVTKVQTPWLARPPSIPTVPLKSHIWKHIKCKNFSTLNYGYNSNDEFYNIQFTTRRRKSITLTIKSIIRNILLFISSKTPSLINGCFTFLFRPTDYIIRPSLSWYQSKTFTTPSLLNLYFYYTGLFKTISRVVSRVTTISTAIPVIITSICTSQVYFNEG